MGREYFLRSRYISSTKRISISEERYVDIKRMRGALSAGLAIEELFDILCSNFVELKNEAEAASSEYINFPSVTYEFGYELMRRINVRAINYITAARFYIDNVPTHIARAADSTASDMYKIKTSQLYDSEMYYRVIYALRNFSLHTGAIIGGVKGSFVPGKGDVIFYVSKKDIQERSDRMKKEIVDEMPEKLNIIEACAGSMSCLNDLHVFVRKQYVPKLENSRADLEFLQEDCSKVLGEKVLLSACAFQGEEEVEHVLLITEWDDVRRYLVDKNSIT
ncbi:hypothetical protein [Pseudomonas nitroreducens]|uniref:hypothetical protein n=1 Tax=Pseudomonas nitroreducens TaxID=46680 RepID=UPI003CC82A66